MPKRIGYLYQKMCDKNLIREAIKEGSRGKKKRWDVVEVMKDVEGTVDKIYELLVTHSFVPTPPKRKLIFDRTCQKNRTIMIVPFFPDGIMHQLCVMVMEPVLMRGMYRWSCASIPGRGSKCAADYIKRALHNDVKGTKYASKLDIRHFYPSIPARRLIRALARKIKDKAFLKMVYEIIASNPDGGLAIGYYINQWLANFYLESLDHFILTLDGVNYYVRNMDDLILMGPNKKKLRKAVKAIAEFLHTRLRVELKGNWQVFPVKSRGIDFVGFRFFHTHTILRRRNFLRFIRQCRRVAKTIARGGVISYHEAAGLLARVGQLKHCDSLMIRQKYFDSIGVKVLKAVVRKHSHDLKAACAA